MPLVRGAHGVLELPVGTIDRTGTAVGDLVVLAAPDPHTTDGPPTEG